MPAPSAWVFMRRCWFQHNLEWILLASGRDVPRPRTRPGFTRCGLILNESQAGKDRWDQYIAAKPKTIEFKDTVKTEGKCLKSRDRDFHQMLLLTNTVLSSRNCHKWQTPGWASDQEREHQQQCWSPLVPPPLLPLPPTQRWPLPRLLTTLNNFTSSWHSYKWNLTRWIPLCLAILLKIMFARFICIFTYRCRRLLPLLYNATLYDYTTIYLSIYFCWAFG